MSKVKTNGIELYYEIHGSGQPADKAFALWRWSIHPSASTVDPASKPEV